MLLEMYEELEETYLNRGRRENLRDMIAIKFNDNPQIWEDRLARLKNPESFQKLMHALFTVQSKEEFAELLQKLD